MIAILEAKRDGLLRLQYLPANIISGVIVGVVALPRALAFAIASGAKPDRRMARFLSLLSLLIVLYSPRLPGLTRVPGPLTALLVATILQAAFGFDGVATIGSTFGGIPQSLPDCTGPRCPPHT